MELNEWFFTDFNESSWLTVCESVCFPKETEDEDGLVFEQTD